MITGLNHITIAVSDLECSLSFYTEILGLKGHVKWDKGAYLSAGSLWFCLSCDKPCPKTDYTHFAFNVEESDYENFRNFLKSKGVEEWKEDKSEGDSLYIIDPDGHKLEIHVGSLDTRLDSLKIEPYSGLKWL
jgi:catechol 2,3-dioxygenase-like lactoylglutathione lyase family enzyme